MRVFGIICAWIVGIVGFFALLATLQLFSFTSFSFYAPRYEAVRRDTMIQSRAYSEANTRELYTLKRQWTQAATDDERNTLRNLALHESDGMDKTRLPDDLQTWLIQIETSN